MKKFDVCVVGEILIDFTISGKNELGMRLFAQNAGGAVANVAAAMGKLGAKCAFIGKAGDDMHGRFLRDTLAAHGVDVSGLLLTPDYFTTLAFVNVREDGEREFSFARRHGADNMLLREDIPLDIMKSARILHMGAVSLADNPARDSTMYAVRQAKEAGMVITYDPNYRASLWASEADAIRVMREVIPYADAMKISDEETELLTGEREPEKAADILLAQGVKVTMVTLGRDGAYVRTREGGRYVPGFAAKAVDATGAGDSFWAGVLTCMTRDDVMPDALTLDKACEYARFGNAVASLCVEKPGAIPAMPEMDAVLARLS